MLISLRQSYIDEPNEDNQEELDRETAGSRGIETESETEESASVKE